MARIGCQDPTQSVVLPYGSSVYEEAIALYEKSGREAQKWQINLMQHILAVNEDGLWTHTKFGYSLPRRNGKNEIVAIREVYALVQGEQVLHTAHRTTTSHAAWERLKRILEKAGYVEGEDFTSLRATGRERIEFLASEGRVEFRTRTSTGGLGEGFDLLVIDEAQEYTDDQESALKYVVTDSKNPQTLFCGTPPTLVSSGTVFVGLREKAIGGTAKNTGWAEWSVEDETDPHDVEAWYRCNPSLGTIFTERSVEDEIGDDVIDFNIQRLGLWLKYNQKSAISEKDWDAVKVAKVPKLVGKLSVGVKYGKNGSNVALSVAVRTLSGKVFVESVDCRPVRAGNNWILQFLSIADVASVVIDGANGQNLLLQDLREQGIKGAILPTVKQVIDANAKWEQMIYGRKLCHAGQPSLHDVVTNCDKRLIGSQGGFGYKSIFDDKEIALMDSAILAVWACSETKVKKKQRVSV